MAISIRKPGIVAIKIVLILSDVVLDRTCGFAPEFRLS